MAWPVVHLFSLHLCPLASLQSGGAIYVSGLSSVTISDGSTIVNSTAARVRCSVALEDSCVCVVLHVILLRRPNNTCHRSLSVCTRSFFNGMY